jgi:hypothetical protein
MIFRSLPMLAAVLGLAGCAAAGRYEFSRFDGAAIPPHEMERVRVECSAEGVKAQSQVGFQGFGMAGAVERGLAKGQATRAAEEACLARNGIKVAFVPDKPA